MPIHLSPQQHQTLRTGDRYSEQMTGLEQFAADRDAHPADLIEILHSEFSSLAMRDRAAYNPALDLQQLQVLASETDADWYPALVGNPNCDADLIRQLWNSRYIRSYIFRVIRHPNTPDDILVDIARGYDWIAPHAAEEARDRLPEHLQCLVKLTA